jgi:SAM-dependent methyltransferase
MTNTSEISIESASAKHNKPVDYAPSKFVLDSLNRIDVAPNSNALDIPCGFGRHSILLAAKQFNVYSADYDTHALSDDWHKRSKNIYPIRLDAKRDLPFNDEVFEVVVVVHFVYKEFLSNLKSCISPGGYLIYETYSGNGHNWISLPKTGELLKELDGYFEILEYKEKSVGPMHKNCTVKLLARKCTANKIKGC